MCFEETGFKYLLQVHIFYRVMDTYGAVTRSDPLLKESARLLHSSRNEKHNSSILLINQKEEITVSSCEEFIKQLGCGLKDKVKVVSIFGNTGDGKSHTLNHTFFSGKEVFRTSSHQSSCTVGIWAAYSPEYSAVFLDSEGMLGVSHNENQRTRLLLKVLAVSDIVIYRTRAERLHNDLFTFLGDASEAYWKYFTPELKAASERCKLSVPLSTLGPSVIIFHETQHTDILGQGSEKTVQKQQQQLSYQSTLPETQPDLVQTQAAAAMSVSQVEDGFEMYSSATCDQFQDAMQDVGDEGSKDKVTHPPSRSGDLPLCKADSATELSVMSAEELLRIRFAELGCIPKAFCSVEYVGTRTQSPPTDFTGLGRSVEGLLRNNAVRAPRVPAVVLKALQVLNEKFSGEIENTKPTTFPDAYFTCPDKCLACGSRCELSMNHGKDGVVHKITTVRCKYSHHYDNKIYLCRTCFNRGTESVVVPKTSASGEGGWMGIAKYAWAGYVMECKQCGVIYRSRKHWYGNKDPEQNSVKTENKHIWTEDLPTAGQGSDNTGRWLLDGMGSVAGAVGSVSAKPSKMVSSWMADQVAPSYWTPNAKITVCGECKKKFSVKETKHHCRACGDGFCDGCCSKSMPVPWRDWGNVPVKVCLSCYKKYRGSTRGTAKDKELVKKQSNSGKQMEQDIKQQTTTSTTLQSGHSQERNVTARYVGEMMHSAVGMVTGAFVYPKDVIVESARPVYWVPDAEMKACHKCKLKFDSKESKHHCRACGNGFCDQCSSQRCPVPSRGWDYPVRVCDACAKRNDL